MKQEVLGLKLSLSEANDQCTLLFNEVQKAWRVSSTLQTDLKVNTTHTTALNQTNAKLNTVNYDHLDSYFTEVPVV